MGKILTATTLILLILSLEIGAKSIAKRHVRYDWLMIPDAIGFYTYEVVRKVYPPAGKFLMDIFEDPVVQQARAFLIEKTSQLSEKAGELQRKLTHLWNDLTQQNGP